MFVVGCSTTYHLLVETADGNLIQGIRPLNGVGRRGDGAGLPIRNLRHDGEQYSLYDGERSCAVIRTKIFAATSVGCARAPVSVMQSDWLVVIREFGLILRLH